MDYAAKFPAGLAYAEFLQEFGTADHRERWAGVHERIALTDDQRTVLAGFRRRINVLCMAGAWCGDCVEQCPIFDHFERASDPISVRFFDRDAHADLQETLTICGAARVPQVVFLNEDFQPLGRYGDRTLSKYRQMAADKLGAFCPTGLIPPGEALMAGVVPDWLDEFERVHLIARLSPRLREKHAD